MNKLKTFLMQYPLETVLISIITISGITLNFNIYSRPLLKVLIYSYWALQITVPFIFATSLLQKNLKLPAKIIYPTRTAIILLSYLYLILILPTFLITVDKQEYLSYKTYNSFTEYVSRPQFSYEILIPLLLGLLTIILIPYFTQKKKSNNTKNKLFLDIILQLFISVFIGIVYGLATFIGLEIANGAISELWTYPPSIENVNWDMIILLISFNFIAYKVTINNLDIKNNKLFNQLLPWIENLVKYLLTPLFAFYSVILYPYIAKILITGEWSSNTITPLALVYSILAMIIITILHFDMPQKQKRLITALVPPVVLIQLYGLYLRIHTYGLTVNRFELVLIALIIFLLSTYYTTTKKYKLVITVYAGLLLIFLTPLIFYISEKAQIKRHLELLKEHGVQIEKGKIVPPTQIILLDNKTYWDILHSATYLWNYHGFSPFKKILPKDSFNKLHDSYYSDTYFLPQNYFDLLNVDHATPIYNKTDNSIEYEKSYSLKEILPTSYWDNAGLDFQFFQTPVTINKLDSIEYNNAYIKQEGDHWVLYTETDSFLIPNEVMNYMLDERKHFETPEIILLKSNDNIKSYLLITNITLTKGKESDHIKAEDLMGILMYAE